MKTVQKHQIKKKKTFRRFYETPWGIDLQQ